MQPPSASAGVAAVRKQAMFAAPWPLRRIRVPELCLVDAFAFALSHDRRNIMNIAPEIRSPMDDDAKGLSALNTVRDAYGRAGSLAYTALA